MDPSQLMALVSGTRAAQFTPAGVLRLPLDGLTTPDRILEFLKQSLAELGHGLDGPLTEAVCGRLDHVVH